MVSMRRGTFAIGTAAALVATAGGIAESIKSQIRRKSEMHITPFVIDPETVALADLRARLRAVRWSDAVTSGWDYGMARNTLDQAVEIWREYDWVARCEAFRALPQFRAVIDGFGIHFLHFRGVGPSPRPLLLANGWPSSFIEYLRVAPALADPGLDGGDPGVAFDVVIPSMPGYGFSDRPTRSHQVRALDLYYRLMTDGLGYSRFAIAGSDIGLGIATRMPLEHPEAVSAIHVTGAVDPPKERRGPPYTDAERHFLAEAERWNSDESAYQAVQSTRPQTLAFALADSPVGLASWILDKFHSWSDLRNSDMFAVYGNALFDNLTVYWLTNTIGSSMRFYYESARWPRPFAANARIAVSTSVLVTPYDLARPPREWVERMYDVRRYVVAPAGGHFPALEIPEIYIHELRAGLAHPNLAA